MLGIKTKQCHPHAYKYYLHWSISLAPLTRAFPPWRNPSAVLSYCHFTIAKETKFLCVSVAMATNWYTKEIIMLYKLITKQNKVSNAWTKFAQSTQYHNILKLNKWKKISNEAVTSQNLIVLTIWWRVTVRPFRLCDGISLYCFTGTMDTIRGRLTLWA